MKEGWPAEPLPFVLAAFASGIALAPLVPLRPGTALAAALACLAFAGAPARRARVKPPAPHGEQAREPAPAGAEPGTETARGRIKTLFPAGAVSLAACFLLIGLAGARTRLAVLPSDISRLPLSEPLLIEGTVTGEDAGPGRSVIRAGRVLEPVRAENITGRILLSSSGPAPPLRPGDIVALRLELERVPEGSGPYPDNLARRGIRATARIRETDVALSGRRRGGFAVGASAHRLRGRLENILESRIHEEPHLSIVKALSFGLARPARALRNSFRRAGIYHLLVVSGLHTGFFVILLRLLLAPLPIPPRFRALLYLPCLAFYALLCGLATPVVRAVIMAGFYFSAQALERPARPLNALYCAAFVLLLANPLNLFEPGWQLSFGITLGLIVGIRSFASGREEGAAPAGARGRLAHKMRPAATASLVGQWVALPLTAFHFGSVPLLGFAANLVFIPLAGVIVLLAFPILLPGPPGRLAADAAWPFISIFHLAAERAGALPFASLEVRPGNPLFFLWYLTAFAPALARRAKNHLQRTAAYDMISGQAEKDDRRGSWNYTTPGLGRRPESVPAGHAQDRNINPETAYDKKGDRGNQAGRGGRGQAG